MINLIIDGMKVSVPEGTKVIEAAKEVGVEIPALCYDKNLEIVSSCRLCVVDIEGERKPLTACSTPVREGMVVHTESDKVVGIRKQLLRLLLDNHPNDCLTCQKSGECYLQRYAYRYDVAFRVHDGERRGKDTAGFSDTSSPYILRDESKCILCGKCVRTCGEVATRAVLTFANRGFYTKISADMDQSLEESSCVSCNRCVTVCPVGALIDRRVYDEKMRSWDVSRSVIKCKSCDYGCNFEVLKKDDKKVIRARNPLNGRPLCLKGRLMTEAENNTTLRMPYKKVEENGKRVFKQVSWAEALELDNILMKIGKEDNREA